MRLAGLALFFALALGASAALAQENQTNPTNQTNATNQTPSPSPSPTPLNATPTPTPAPATGRLKIITVPVDGDILVDRALVGTGIYLNDSYPAGTYRLEFGFVKGYTQPAPKVMTVQPGQLNSFFGEYTPRAVVYPKLTVVREVSPTSLATGDTVNVLLRFSNDGTGKAVNVSINDTLPPCASSPVGDTTWTGQLQPGDEQRILYTATASKPGLCVFESANVTYEGEDGTAFRASAQDVSISVAARVVPEPKLVVTKSAAAQKSVGDDVVVNVELQNVGSATALKVRMNDTLPDCAQFSAGTLSFQDDIPAGDSRTVTYQVTLGKAGLCVFDISRVAYHDAAGATMNATSKQLNIFVKERSFAEVLSGWTQPITIIAGALGSIVFLYTLVHKAKSKVVKKKDEKK